MRAREQAKHDRSRGKRAPTPAPDPHPDQLTIDDALADLARDEHGNPVTVPAEPAATANYETR